MKQLRHNIRRVGVLLLICFALLVLYGYYSLTNYGSRWFSTSANTWLRSAKQDVIPGDIYDANGILLAGSVVTDTADGFTASRQYNSDPAIRRATAHVIGDSAGKVANSVETFMAKSLYGFDQSITERVRDFISRARRKGDTLTLTVDSALSTYILERLERLTLPVSGSETVLRIPSGSVVVMNWKTGAVLAELSYPTFDPLSMQTGEGNADQPYFNRATQGRYAPGSAFTAVTAAAVLSDPLLNGRSYTCTGSLMADDTDGLVREITDAGTDRAQGLLVAHGQIDLRRAFRIGCKNTFASAALQLTDVKLRKQAMAFGFDANFVFRDIVLENSSYPDDAQRTDWQVAMTGIGQSDLLTTPMHLCLIASAIANGGTMMEPRLIAQATASDGTVRRRFESRIERQIYTDHNVADTLKDYMYDTVNAEGGTGRAAALNGWRICGKDGIIEADGQERADVLFIGFIDDASAPYAIAIVLEDTGSGSDYAAPVAHDIFEYLTEHLQNTD